MKIRNGKTQRNQFPPLNPNLIAKYTSKHALTSNTKICTKMIIMTNEIGPQNIFSTELPTRQIEPPLLFRSFVQRGHNENDPGMITAHQYGTSHKEFRREARPRLEEHNHTQPTADNLLNEKHLKLDLSTNDVSR